MGTIYTIPFVGYQSALTPFISKVLGRFMSKKSKTASLINFMGLFEAVKKEHPHVFNGGGSSGKKNFGWQGIILDLGGGPFGTFSQVEQVLISDGLTYMEKLAIQRVEMERKNK